MDWGKRRVKIDLSMESIKNSPEYDSSVPLSAEYEERLREHYVLPIERGIGPL